MSYTIFEPGPHGDREYDIYSWLANKGTLWIRGTITEATVDMVGSQLLAMRSQSKDNATMLINSPGGDVYACLSIIDFMKQSGIKVRTVCVGKAFSAAAVLLMSGAKGERYCLPNTYVMVHDISSGTQGTYRDMAIDQRHCAELRENFKKLYLQNTHVVAENVDDFCFNRDRYMSPETALEYGFIDKIMRNEIAI